MLSVVSSFFLVASGVTIREGGFLDTILRLAILRANGL